MDCIATNICRACLKESDTLHALFEIYENDISLASILQNLLNIELDCCEQLPTSLCQECATILIQFHNFSVVFEESTRKLLALLGGVDGNNKNEGTENESDTQIDLNDKVENSEVLIDVKDTNVDSDVNCEKIYLLPCDYLESETDTCKYKCDMCQRSFKNLLLFKRHLKLHIENRRFICEFCGYVAYKKSYFIDHMEMHTKDKPYKCKFCGKTFRRRSAFSRHKRIHTNPKQIICEICGKSFTDRGTLKTHTLLLHIKRRDFKCIICDQLFPLKGTLVKHMRRHQQKEGASKDFSCTDCNMQYFDKSSLNRHYLTKHSDVDFKKKCPFCNKAYTTKTNLLKHTKKHHKDKEFT